MGRAKTGGKGKNRQPGKPKRATSAYLYFLSHLRDQLKAQGKSIKIGELAKEAAEKWHAMDSDTRYVRSFCASLFHHSTSELVSEGFLISSTIERCLIFDMSKSHVVILSMIIFILCQSGVVIIVR